MVKICGLDKESFNLSVDAIGSSWVDVVTETEDGLDVRLAESAKLHYAYDTLTIVDGLHETTFDIDDFISVEIF